RRPAVQRQGPRRPVGRLHRIVAEHHQRRDRQRADLAHPRRKRRASIRSRPERELVMTEEARAAMADAGIDLSRIACVSVATRDADALLFAYVDALGLEVTRDMQESPRGFGLRWIEVGQQGRTLFE